MSNIVATYMLWILNKSANFQMESAFIVFIIIYCKKMTMSSMLHRYGLPVLIMFLNVVASTTEKLDFHTDLNTTTEFENNATEEYITATTAGEIPNDYLNESMNALNVINVSPGEIVVDTPTELQLSIANYTGSNTTPVLCFLITPDSDLEILPSHWISNSKINCTSFRPLVSGLYSLTADSSNVQMSFDKNVTFRVISKHPVAERAEYSYSYDKIFIYFDANIQLQSNCGRSFSKRVVEYFGAGFRCVVRGDVLIVMMGVDFKPIANVEISDENQICRSGSRKEFCLTAKPGNVDVATPKVVGLMLTFLTTSDCAGNASQKQFSLKVSTNDRKQNSDRVSPSDGSGRSQRKNLLVWRTLRRIQNKFSSNLTLRIDKSDMRPLYENLASVENILEKQIIPVGSSRPGVTVSVYVHSSPAVGTILAEADVVFCEFFNELFRYKWIVNGNLVAGDDKLLLLQETAPGKYIIACHIIAYNSSEVLGQGWAATEIFDSKPKVIVYPVEVVTTSAEDVSLHAVIWHGETISWACKTSTNKVCVTITQQLISDVVNMNTANLSIPAGILPAGEYVWTVENAQGINTAKIIIKLENAVAMNFKVSSVFVSQSQNTVLHGTVKGVQNGCRLWWSGVRQKGFNYFNLQKVTEHSQVLVRDGETEQKTDLVFPRSLKNREGLEPGSLYMFKLQAFCPRSVSYDYIKIPISVNDPPRVSAITVEPRKGSAMKTEFVISEVQVDDSDEDYPLLFEWSYTDTCGTEIPITKGAYSRQMTTFLPPGDIKVILRVCDVKKACSKVSSSVIEVNHSKITPENFHNAANQIYYLLVGGDYLKGFGLATTVLKSLALKPETEIRREVFRSVKEGIFTRIKQCGESENPAKSCLDFVERAFVVASHFPKRSGINEYLTDFKNTILFKTLRKV